MAELSGAEVIARTLKEEGVQHFFGVHGGHIWSFINAVCEQRIKMMHMRHEQSGVYAADGWGRTTRRPGVCFGTAGPGMFNMVAGLAHAYLCESPVVAFVGQHPPMQDGWKPFQEGYAEQVCGSVTKWTKRILDVRTVGYEVRRAFQDAVAYPPGPVVIEVPMNILDHRRDEREQRGLTAKEMCPPAGRTLGDHALVEQAVRMLLEAEKPIVIGGSGIFWADAVDDLREFVELTQIPVHTRRMARGAVPETHPLAFGGGFRRPILAATDVACIIGLRLHTLENFGLPPTYSHAARYIQISESPVELSTMLPSEARILGHPKLVLRQMIDCAKSLMKTPPKRPEWLAMIAKLKEAALRETREQVDPVRGARPIDPNYLCQAILDFLDPSATIIFDSFSGSGFITDKIQANFAGQVLDAGTDGGVGHGIGMGIGAQLGRPGKQVLALMGDGGMGVGGMDIETAARYELPVCYVVINNSGWITTEFQKLVCPKADSWGMLPDIRYDKMFEENDCHGEFVTEPEQIIPALERAFDSGKTSVVNVIIDKTVLGSLHRSRMANYDKGPKSR